MSNTGTVPRRQAGLFMFRWRQTCLAQPDRMAATGIRRRISIKTVVCLLLRFQRLSAAGSLFLCLWQPFIMLAAKEYGNGKHWSRVEYLHQTVTNPNIIVKVPEVITAMPGAAVLKNPVVRYHYGDRYSRTHWQPQWPIDRLQIGNYVCIGAESVILMGGNNTHRNDWFSNYPFMDKIVESYQGKGDTVIEDAGMDRHAQYDHAGTTPWRRFGDCGRKRSNERRSPYAVVGGNPARVIKFRFAEPVISRLLALRIYDLDEAVIDGLTDFLCAGDIDALEQAVRKIRWKSL